MRHYVRTAADLTREEFNELKAEGSLPDGYTYQDFLDDYGTEPESPEVEEETQYLYDEEWIDEATDLVMDHSPGKIKNFGYSGDLDDAWAYTLSVNRDSDTLTKSNFEVVKRDMEKRFPNDVTVENASHWAVGWVDHLAVRVLDDRGHVTAAGAAILEWKHKLDDYPIADEEHWSEMQYELAMESMDQDIEYILNRLDLVRDLTQADYAAVYEWINENREYAMEYVEQNPEQNSLDESVIIEAAEALGLVAAEPID